MVCLHRTQQVPSLRLDQRLNAEHQDYSEINRNSQVHHAPSDEQKDRSSVSICKQSCVFATG